MLTRIDTANEEIRLKGKDVVVRSGEYGGVVPQLAAPRECKDVWRDDQGLSSYFKNIDYKSAGVFVVVNCTQQEISESGLAKVVPFRKHPRARKLTPATLELNTCRDEGEAPSKFWPMREDLIETETRSLLVKVVEVGVRLVMRNHSYKL